MWCTHEVAVEVVIIKRILLILRLVALVDVKVRVLESGVAVAAWWYHSLTVLELLLLLS